MPSSLKISVKIKIRFDFFKETLPEKLNFFHRGLSQLECDVLLEGGVLADNFSPGGSKVVVSEAGELARALLDIDCEALLGEHSGHGWSAGHPLLVGPGLGRHTDTQLVVGSPLDLLGCGISQPPGRGSEASDGGLEGGTKLSDPGHNNYTWNDKCL